MCDVLEHLDVLREDRGCIHPSYLHELMNEIVSRKSARVGQMWPYGASHTKLAFPTPKAIQERYLIVILEIGGKDIK